MANQLMYINPNTGRAINLAVNLIPTIAMRYNGKQGFGDLEEAYLALVGAKSSAAGVSSTINVSYSALAAYYNLVNGGEYVPHPDLEGDECQLTADVASAGTSITVDRSTKTWRGVSENIFVADRPYLLMHRKPVPGESIFETGTKDGLICPEGEIIYIDNAYTSGTTITISRTTGATDKKKGAIIQALTGHWASRADDSDYAGLLYELERPDVLTLGTQESASSTTVKAVFVKSVQSADTANANGEFGVATHYGIWVVPKTGKFLHSVKGLPENAQPSQFDDTGQVDAVLAIESAFVVPEVISTVSYLTVLALNRAWNPITSALEAISAGWYWVGVKAMNGNVFDGSLRASKIVFGAIEVT